MKVDDPLENSRVRIEAGTERSLQKWTDITEVGGSKVNQGTVFFTLEPRPLAHYHLVFHSVQPSISNGMIEYIQFLECSFIRSSSGF